MAANRRRHQLSEYGADLIADLRRGQTIAIADVALDPRTSSPQALVAFGTASIVGLLDVPVVKAGRLVAILGVHSERPRFWSAEEVTLAEEIAERTWAGAERARAQAEVTAGEERFRGFAEAASDTLWIADAATGRLDHLSPAFERMWGEPRDRVMSDVAQWAELVHPDDRETAVRCHAEGAGTASGWRVEYRIVRIDGEVRWILDVSFPIHDAAGQVTRRWRHRAGPDRSPGRRGFSAGRARRATVRCSRRSTQDFASSRCCSTASEPWTTGSLK